MSEKYKWDEHFTFPEKEVKNDPVGKEVPYEEQQCD